MNYNFKLLTNTYKTVNYINKILLNYPKKEVVLKNNIERDCYEIVELIFAYNINNTDRIREKNLKDLLIKVSMLDFYMRVSFDKKIISKHQYEVLGRFIIEIRKMIYGVKKRNEEMDKLKSKIVLIGDNGHPQTCKGNK